MDLVPRESFPKRYPVISPSWWNPNGVVRWSFHFNPAFDLGFPEFTEHDYDNYATLLDGISDLDVIFDDDPLKPERLPSKRFKHCAYARRRRLQLPLWKMWPISQTVWTYHYLARERESCAWCDPVQYRSQYTLGCEELQVMGHEPFGCKPKWSCTSWSPYDNVMETRREDGHLCPISI